MAIVLGENSAPIYHKLWRENQTPNNNAKEVLDCTCNILGFI
jgi:hypothetical protein